MSNEVTELIRVRVSEELYKKWCKMSEDGRGKWNRIRLVCSDVPMPDYYISITDELGIKLLKSNSGRKIIFSSIEWNLPETYKNFKKPLYQREIITNPSCCSFTNHHSYQTVEHIKGIDFVKYAKLALIEKSFSKYIFCYDFNDFIDGILMESLVFYADQTNFKVREIIDPKAYVFLELSNFEQDLQKINDSINNDLWQKRLPYIRKAKTCILNELQFFPKLESALKAF